MFLSVRNRKSLYQRRMFVKKFTHPTSDFFRIKKKKEKEKKVTRLESDE